MENQPQLGGLTKRQRARSPITATLRERNVDVYSVFDHEFRSIKSAASQSGLYLTFFGVAVGIMVTLLTVLLTVELTSPYTFAAFTVGFGVSVVATAFFGLKARHEYRSTTNQFDYIEQRSGQTNETRVMPIKRPQ